MRVTEQDVGYVADLANLELTQEERARMLRDLNSILEYICRLEQLDTTGVEPMALLADRVTGASGAAREAMREDQARPSLPREEALRNAPDSDGAYFKVPRVIEK